MKYIVNSEEVSKDTFYFCKKAKEENKTFVLLNPTKGVESYINNHLEYDYYICDEIRTYVTKGEAITNKWFEKDECYSYLKVSIEDMTKRYNKSKFKDTMTFKDWYTKNGWKYHSEIRYKSERHDIPATRNFKEKDIKTKLFSVIVANNVTVHTINEIKKQYGELSIEYVLRDNNFTEIIYRDAYKEIEA